MIVGKETFTITRDQDFTIKMIELLMLKLPENSSFLSAFVHEILYRKDMLLCTFS